MSRSEGARRFVWLLIAALVWGCGAAADPLVNRLRGHPAPYLAMHGADPVAWQEWNAATLARAQRENKLLFVSVGYFACHWCHVMQRESFRDPRIAEVLNRDFIPVKVDRELNGGLDDALQDFSARMNGAAGWPLNAFVTPDGHPAFVVLYAPPDELRALLERLAQRWRSEHEAIRALARRAAPPAPAPVSEPLSAARVAAAWQAFLDAAWQEADPLNGGFGAVAKFPKAPHLAVLLEAEARKPDAKRAEFLRLTLDQMAARGLRDHVRGGFFRYTIDPSWDTPHFEKMLADNAQLAVLYLRAADVLDRPRYRTVALAALDFLRRELQDARHGGLYSSTSAVDARGREGAVYLWEPAELRRLLAADTYRAAARVWRLDRPRPFEHGYLPAEYAAPTAQEAALLEGAYRTLRRARDARAIPRDIKMNAGLNGLALSAFRLGQSVDPSLRGSADRVRDFIVRRLVRGDRLLKGEAGGRTLPDAELDDYAYVVQGLLDDARVTGNARSHALAVRLARTAWASFASASGWQREARPLLATIRPQPVIADGALPSPSETLVRASLASRDGALAMRARRAAAWQSEAVAREPFAYPGRVLALDAASRADSVAFVAWRRTLDRAAADLDLQFQ